MAQARRGGDMSGDRKTLKVTQVKSTIGFNKKQGDVVRGLGLRRIRHTIEVLDTPEMRGMIHKVRHLVTVE
jgi:large subunit ribosomal protein L30